MIETSEDGDHFQALETVCHLIAPGVFDRFELEPENGLPPGARFLRVVLCNPEPEMPRITQYAGVSWSPFQGCKMAVGLDGLPEDYQE